MDENKSITAPPTNTERLRAHLTANGLTVALLSAWEKGDPTTAQANLLTALVKFYFPEKTGNDNAKAE